ncbi:MAG TPA: LPS assembly lipoprotein LptE [Acetobacteraceae bacterium]|nr:LPS assembly lipoprotein LptE [Acetobacteraceae bacterium]
MRRSWLLSALLMTPLAGCGWSPVYAPAAAGGSPMADLGQIYVPVIPDRTGQELRQALQVRLEGSGAPSAKKYTLAVSYGISSEGIGIDPFTDVTFIRYEGHASWQLLGAVPGTPPLATGQVNVQDGYSVIVNQYFYQNLDTDALYRRMADNVADQIVVRVAAYFQTRDKVAQK